MTEIRLSNINLAKTQRVRTSTVKNTLTAIILVENNFQTLGAPSDHFSVGSF